MSRPLFLSAALAGAAIVVALALHATAQQQPPATVVVQRSDGTIVEQTVDGKILRITAAREPQAATFGPVKGADGRNFYAAGGGFAPQDAESLKLATQEQSAAQEARSLATQYAAADSDSARAEAKTKLREKLAAIFDLQQQRRAREISQIEERLGKLKETMKKRDASKDPIIDRRLDQLTGGVDELGWEESGGNPNATPYGHGAGYSLQEIPSIVPGKYPPPMSAAPVPSPLGR